MRGSRSARLISSGLITLGLVMIGEARADFIAADWTSFSSNSASGTLNGTTITGSIIAGAPFTGIVTGSWAPPIWQAPQPLPVGAEAIALQPVNAGAEHVFSFSTPFSFIRFYVDDFDSASDAIITAVGATSISLVAASPSMSYTPISTTSGRLLTTNGGFNGEGDAILEIFGSVQSVRLQYSNGIQNNGLSYTFATTAVPEPSSLLSATLGLLGMAGYAGWRRERSREVS